MSTQKNMIQPISAFQQEQVITETNRYINLAANYFDNKFDLLPVLFDLSGRAAGMYRVQANQRVIRFNPYIFAKYFEDNFCDTVPHEVAHYVTDLLYGLTNIRPHGDEWKSVMQVFGLEAKRTGNYDLTGIPRRQHKTFTYHCSCQNYDLTSRRHNKVKNGTGNYLCRSCGDKLIFIKSNEEKD